MSKTPKTKQYAIDKLEEAGFQNFEGLISIYSHGECGLVIQFAALFGRYIGFEVYDKQYVYRKYVHVDCLQYSCDIKKYDGLDSIDEAIAHVLEIGI